jgi:hypothetical protein
LKIDFQHVDGQDTVLTMNHDAAYVLALALIRASDHGFDFKNWGAQELRDWSLNFITPAEGSLDYDRAYVGGKH